MGNNDNSDQPHVSFRINATIKDKGLGFSIKQGLEAYFRARKLGFRTRDFKAVSRSADMIIDIFPEDGSSYTQQAIKQAILNSGRTGGYLKPSDIEVTMIPPREEDNRRESVSPSDGGELENRLDEAQKTIVGLEEEIGQKNTELGERGQMIDELLGGDEAVAVIHKDPFDALLYGYVLGGRDALKEISSEYGILDAQDDLDMILVNGVQIDAFFQYVNNKVDSGFGNNDELTCFLSEYDADAVFDDLSQVKAFRSRQETYRKDLVGVDAAREAGVSEDILQAMQDAVKTKYAGMVDEEEDLGVLMDDFDANKERASIIETLRQSYGLLCEVKTAVKDRKQQAMKVPVLIDDRRCWIAEEVKNILGAPEDEQFSEGSSDVARKGFGFFVIPESGIAADEHKVFRELDVYSKLSRFGVGVEFLRLS